MYGTISHSCGLRNFSFSVSRRPSACSFREQLFIGIDIGKIFSRQSLYRARSRLKRKITDFRLYSNVITNFVYDKYFECFDVGERIFGMRGARAWARKFCRRRLSFSRRIHTHARNTLLATKFQQGPRENERTVTARSI